MNTEKDSRLIVLQNFMEKAPKLTDEEFQNLGYDINEIREARANIKGVPFNIEKNPEHEKLKDEFVYLTHGREKKIAEATELLVQYILKNNYIYTTKDDIKSEMWIYRGGIYIPQGKSEIKEILREILEEQFNSFYFSQVINKIEADTFIEQEVFFNKNYVYEIPVENGILNIETRELTPFNPEKIFFSKMPVTYNPDANCPLIDKFLGDVLTCPDDKLVYYEIGGFCLLKNYKYEKTFMFLGDGRNGKGKAIELYKRVLGVSNCASVPLQSLKTDSFQISELFGKMVNLAGDLNNTDLKETGMFKSLSGRDLVSAKRKFLRDIVFENYAKFIFACNELPMVYDVSKGFWDRWVLLQFPYYFADKESYEQNKNEEDKKHWKLRDDAIIDKITSEEELSGLLNKFLDGYGRLKQNGKFSITKGSEEIKNLWIRRANSFMAFCMDFLEQDVESRIEKAELRRSYSNYTKKYKLMGKSDIIIKRTLEELYGASEIDNNKYDEQRGYYKVRYWEGIKWK